MFMGEKIMTALERTEKVINDLHEAGVVTKFKSILYRKIGQREIFVIPVCNSLLEAKMIKYAIKAEFREITLSFTCVKEAVAFTIKS